MIVYEGMWGYVRVYDGVQQYMMICGYGRVQDGMIWYVGVYEGI